MNKSKAGWTHPQPAETDSENGLMLLHRAAFWRENDCSSDPIAVEVARTDSNEVAVYLRGLSGLEDQGTFYVNKATALSLSQALLNVAMKEPK